MLELALLIGMLVMGVAALAKGSIKLSPRRSVEGTPARIIGVILLLPLPLAFGMIVALGVSLVRQDQGQDEIRLRLWLNLVNVGMIVAAVVTAVVIGVFTAKPTRKRAYEAASDAEELPRGAAAEESMGDGKHCPACGVDIGLWPIFSACSPNRIWCPRCNARLGYRGLGALLVPLLLFAAVLAARASWLARSRATGVWLRHRRLVRRVDAGRAGRHFVFACE